MEENKLYTIGKISSIMDISIQTLRFYERIGLFEPCHVNPDTGYRYYEYSQMHKIDRIRYLQKMGLSLKDIKAIYDSGNIDALLETLKNQKKAELEELENTKKRIDDLNWYIDYFSFLKDKKHFGMMYLKHFEHRYAMVVDMGDVPFSVSNELFYTLRNKAPYKNIECQRQYVSILDETALKQGKTLTLKYGQYLKEDPGLRDNHLIELPSGEYMCFLAPIYWKDHWQPSIFEPYLDPNQSYLIIAAEYEDNLYSWEHCIYEVQFIEYPNSFMQ